MSWIPSASQTVGPFFNFALTTNANLGVLAQESGGGERIKLTVTVLDGEGLPASGDAMIELWQADAHGCYAANADAGFCGFGRLETALDGTCVFETIKPGRVGEQAPHINVMVFARGLLRHLHTRVYFEGDPANLTDSVLSLVPEQRQSTLLAKPVSNQPNAWRFDIRLQGGSETVFFDL